MSNLTKKQINLSNID